jgi:hypothetical protein
MMRGGECSVLSMPERRTSESEFGFWPTPCLPGNGGTNGKAKLKKMLWPTPDTCAGGTGPSQVNRNQPRLQDAVKMWATPNARDWKEQTLSLALARAHGNAEKSRQLPRQMSAECPELRGGKLNPMWVEKLMGWPKNWTDMNPMIDSHLFSWIMGFCEHEKTRTNQALHLLRRSPYAQSFQRKTGRPFGIQEAEILLSQLREHPHGLNEAWIQLAGAEAPEAEVRGVRTHAKTTGSPCGSGHLQQLTGEHPDAVQALSRFLAHDGQETWADGSWEDATPRTAVGVAARVDRLRCLGNGQVPAVVRLAWETLNA